MMFSTSAVVLLAALLLAPRTALGRQPPTCTSADDAASVNYCRDCKTRVSCKDTNAPPTVDGICTNPGEACAVVDEIATCVPLADSPCSCDHPQQCDPYDNDAVLVCLSSGSTVVTPCAAGETCFSNKCDKSPCTAGSSVDEYVLIKPECTSAVYCVIGGAAAGTVDCSVGEYFDPELRDCAISPPVPCDGGCRGVCPDKTNCSRYYLCDSSSEADLQDCPPGSFFDIIGKVCFSSNYICTPTVDCAFEERTPTTTMATTDGVTTKPTECTEDNLYEQYPNEENCKMFWMCALVAPGQYEYLEMTCSGDLVYNPTTSACDYPENVPDCVLTTTSAQ